MANENKTAKEYVRKGYLIAHLANCGIRTINYDEWERLCGCIHEAKPADVVEVVPGEWKYTGISEGINDMYMCSNCAMFVYSKKWNYCPNCGADMRERREDARNGNS